MRLLNYFTHFNAVGYTFNCLLISNGVAHFALKNLTTYHIYNVVQIVTPAMTKILIQGCTKRRKQDWNDKVLKCQNVLEHSENFLERNDSKCYEVKQRT